MFTVVRFVRFRTRKNRRVVLVLRDLAGTTRVIAKRAKKKKKDEETASSCANICVFWDQPIPALVLFEA